MTRVRLTIVRGPHQPSFAAGHNVVATRVLAKVGFSTDTGWTPFDTIAIVDTGAPLSLLPEPMWRKIERRILSPVMVGGVAEKPECKFGADLAIIQCAVTDGIAILGPFRMHALLAHNDRVPALLGLSGFFDELGLAIVLGRNEAYFELA